MILIVTGCRNFTDHGFVFEQLDKYKTKGLEMVYVGDASGVDYYTEQWCKVNDIPHKVYQAEWYKFGKSAGPRRNQKMLEAAINEAFFDCKILRGLAIWDYQSSGTSDCIRRMYKNSISVEIIPIDGAIERIIKGLEWE